MGQLGTQRATVKNVSGGTLTVRGHRLQNNEEYELSGSDILAWDNDPYFQDLVASGTLSILTHSAGRFWKKSTAESSTTSTTWQQKVSLNMDVTVSGTYRMGYTANIWNSGASKTTSWRVQIDDATPNVDVVDVKGTNENSVGGFHYQTLLSGSHTLDMDYKTSSGGTATISKARLEYWQELSETEEV